MNADARPDASGRRAFDPAQVRRAALRIFGALALTLALGEVSARLIAETWLAPRCEAYGVAHGIDFDGVEMRRLKRRKYAARISPCLFSDRTPAKGAVPIRWRELGDVPTLVRLGVDPALMSLLIGAIFVGAWLVSPAGVAYRLNARKRSG